MDKSNKKYKQNYICDKCGKIFQTPTQSNYI